MYKNDNADALLAVLAGRSTVALECADSLVRLKALPDNSVDAVVCDPPYEIGFMGRGWDRTGIAYSVDLWSEALRVLKPGGHLLAFAAARTYHRITCAIEDAGFEIRDQIMWVYGSGFPKSQNVAKAIDKAAGAAHEVAAWDGWGTALKPAHEPICMARKPLEKGLTVAANVRKWGAGAINIDASRVPHVTVGDGSNLALNPHLRTHINGGNGGNIIAHEAERRVVTPDAGGRWPANLIHDGSPEVVDLFPAEAGASAPVRGTEASAASVGNVTGARARVAGAFHADKGSAARFFYCAKASSRDRHDGLTNPGPQFKHGATLRQIENTAAGGNDHPTVKPTALMRYLCALVTPPGGVVLDIFMGSGSTGRGARLGGFRFIGFELDPHNVEISCRRIAAVELASAEAAA